VAVFRSCREPGGRSSIEAAQRAAWGHLACLAILGRYHNDGDPGTDRIAVFQTFDAFGVNVTKPLLSARAF